MAEDVPFDDGQADVDQGTSHQSAGATDSFSDLVPAFCVASGTLRLGPSGQAAAGASERAALGRRWSCVEAFAPVHLTLAVALTPRQPHLPLYTTTAPSLTSHSFTTTTTTFFPFLTLAWDCDSYGVQRDDDHSRPPYPRLYATDRLPLLISTTTDLHSSPVTRPRPSRDPTSTNSRLRSPRPTIKGGGDIHHQRSNRNAVCVA